MSWLVTGGAGYIGSHIVAALLRAGQSVVVLDDLSTGRRDRVPPEAPFVKGSIADERAVRAVFDAWPVRSIIHLAAKKAVEESVADPLLYYRENVEGLRSLLSVSVGRGLERFVFSSSASVYGEPSETPVHEDAPTLPVNPYGETKMIGEWMIADVARAYGIAAVALRYFNVAGAESPTLADTGVTNLVPRLLLAAERGDVAEVYGGDWPTRDGSCIRDYIDVRDLAEAHVAVARSATLPAGGFSVYNLGTGRGTTVWEMIDAVSGAVGRPLQARVGPRRAGDPAAVVASVDKVAEEVGWRARYDIAQTAASAWACRSTGALVA